MSQFKVPDNWEALPIKDVTIGGVKRKVKYDNEINKVYLLDEHGEWTGEAGSPPPPKAAAAPKNDDNKSEASDDQEGEKESKRRKPKVRSKSTPFLIAIIIVLGALLLMQNNSPATQKKYSVIIAMENIQPGDTIKGKLAAYSITADEYYKYASTGGLYLDTEYKKIEGYYATSFIPKDGYISYTNVGESFQVANPWKLTGNTHTITVPIDATIENLDQFLWGNEVSLSITAKSILNTEKYPDANRPSSPEVTGSSTLQSVQIDTYRLENVTVIDVLNDQKRSLYSAYAALAAIPRLYQDDCLKARYSTGNQVQTDMPAYIKIAVSEKTAEWWEKITSRQYTVSVKVTTTGIKCETAYQSDTYLAMKNMLPSMKSAWKASLEDT